MPLRQCSLTEQLLYAFSDSRIVLIAALVIALKLLFK